MQAGSDLVRVFLTSLTRIPEGEEGQADCFGKGGPIAISKRLAATMIFVMKIAIHQ